MRADPPRTSCVRRDAPALLLSVLAGVLAPAPLWAQTGEAPPAPAPTPTAPPVPSPNPSAPDATEARPADLTDPSLEQLLRDRQRRQGAEELIPPTLPGRQPGAATPQSSIPGLTTDDIDIKPGRFFPEGTFLVRRDGTLVTTRSGDVIFIPQVTPESKDARGRGERPMVVLPSQTLARLQGATSAGSSDVKVTLSGQLFVYRDRQYILPTVFAIKTGDPAAAPVPPSSSSSAAPASSSAPVAESDPAVRPASGEDPAARGDPQVAELIKELDQRRGAGRAISPRPKASEPKPRPASDAKPAGDLSTTPPREPPPPPTSQPSAAASGAAATTPPTTPPEPAAGARVRRVLVPEGTVLVDRRARVVEVGRELAMAFDNDTDIKAEAPLIILRCRALERLEATVAQRGADFTLRVSGRIFVYRNTNYFLPTLYQVETPSDVQPLQ